VLERRNGEHGSLATAILISAIGSGCMTSDSPAGDPPPVEFDLGADFSVTQNPNGPWRYGFSRATTPSAGELELDTFVNPTFPVGFWHPTGASDGYYPYVAHNADVVTTADPTDSWAVRPGEVAMEGSPAGQYSLVQFVAPRSAPYDIQASFAGIHFRLSTTDVHVLDGDVSLYDQQIDGYGGDPAFFTVQGGNPQARYATTRSLEAGALLTFAVGIGGNGTNYNDTTGLFVHVTEH
jgi:hypothetical protein